MDWHFSGKVQGQIGKQGVPFNSYLVLVLAPVPVPDSEYVDWLLVRSSFSAGTPGDAKDVVDFHRLGSKIMVNNKTKDV